MINLLFHFLDEFLFLMCDDPYFIVKVFLNINRLIKVIPLKQNVHCDFRQTLPISCLTCRKLNFETKIFWGPQQQQQLYYQEKTSYNASKKKLIKTGYW